MSKGERTGTAVSDEPRSVVSTTYAYSQLWRALESAQSARDRAVRNRARAKVEKWRAVLDGMATGNLTIGSRTPVADTPGWVTLEVAHGGFATGRYLAESDLDEAERDLLDAVPADLGGSTDRERLNLWFLSDAGQGRLSAALETGRYRVEVPEEGALLVVAWLLANENPEAALDLVSELRPLMHRIRFAPRLTPSPRSVGSSVRLESVETVSAALRATETPGQIAAMREAILTWLPLYDDLVALWCDTVDGELPRLTPEGIVAGGWPCQVFEAGWSGRREQWLLAHSRAAARSSPGRHGHPKSNFARLRTALERADGDSRALSPRDVGWVRRALANTLTAAGPLGSEVRAALRSTQATIAASPDHAALAQVVASRLDEYPSGGGVPSVDPIAQDIRDGEAAGVPIGTSVPAQLIRKVRRALEAPVEDLVELGVITSGEVLARVLPQITSQLLSAAISDERLAGVYAETYGAFRRRRSLLLLNLESQIRFDELPWVAAMADYRSETANSIHAARQALRQSTALALSAFPQAILPNPLVREFGALATQADLKVPFVDEVAADIFMGAFAVKWRDAARIASHELEGTLYARYYDLPAASRWAVAAVRSSAPWSRRRWGKETAEDFAELCKSRAAEAFTADDPKRSYVAQNGAILEQSQILTTHNLVQLIAGLGLREQIADAAPEYAGRIFDWIVERQSQPRLEWRATLQMLKNTAYAWRQAILYLSLCRHDEQAAAIARFAAGVPSDGKAAALKPVVDGLVHVARGGSFDASGGALDGQGRRFLGWSVGPHWMLSAPA
jgi:hypothetical protein